MERSEIVERYRRAAMRQQAKVLACVIACSNRSKLLRLGHAK
jgi:hypothetical protein